MLGNDRHQSAFTAGPASRSSTEMTDHNRRAPSSARVVAALTVEAHANATTQDRQMLLMIRYGCD
jgi:hypothetical protein